MSKELAQQLRTLRAAFADVDAVAISLALALGTTTERERDGRVATWRIERMMPTAQFFAFCANNAEPIAAALERATQIGEREAELLDRIMHADIEVERALAALRDCEICIDWHGTHRASELLVDRIRALLAAHDASGEKGK